MDTEIPYLSTPPEEATRGQAEETIKAWRAKRVERLAADKVAAKLKEDEEQMRDWLVRVFREQNFEGMLIDGKVTGLSDREIHVVEDRESFVEFIYNNKAIDMLQFRVNDAAIALREDEDIAVPGVGKMTVYGLFDRKA